jgi:sulfate transport system ATP-binding protein
MSIEVKNLVKRFGNVTVCDNLTLDIPSGELVALAGPLGLGQDLAAAHHRGAGATRQRLGAVSTAKRRPMWPVRERNVGFVFQHYALFGHMTIFENVAFGLRVRPKDNPAQRCPDQRSQGDRTAQAGATGLDRRPLSASVVRWSASAHCLARALAVEPKVLLLDEPFGALDAKVRKELRRWLRRLHDEMHITSVFVTHDQEEAMEVADRIVVMNQGRIEQEGTPDEVYDHPASPFVLEVPG